MTAEETMERESGSEVDGIHLELSLSLQRRRLNFD